ncbi:MAG: 4Fe-4S dicluster domain-containing protein [Anaerolineae bacterium]|jgi:heterodisulfide reductase subunit A
MIPVTIDGQRIEVEEETTILEAAQRLGIHIPVLCHHPALEPYGACRLCMVEITYNGWSRLVTSCNYPIRWEIEVETASEQVLEVRRLLAELILARCPDVPRVQELAASLGVSTPRFELGDELCYLCGLCVRVCEELIGQSAISFVGRGVDREVGTPFLKFTDACIACGACAFVCPTGAIKLEDITDKEPQPLLSEFDVELLGRGSIFIPFAQAVPKIPVIDREHCLHHTLGRCGTCEYFCEADAIDYNQEDELLDLEVGNIIIATGYDTFDARRISQYGYGRYPNVFTSMEIERMLSGTGPTGGRILLRDGETEPESVAIVHCVGSRDDNYNAYCSEVCCMYSLKLAHLVHDKTDARIYECYIDMRTGGKAYEAFYRRLQTEGTSFINGRPAEILPEDGKLAVYVEDRALGRQMRIPVDMVILSIGLQPRHDAPEVANLFGISCDVEGWFKERHPKLDPVGTTTDGVFIAGCAQGPRDIPDSVAQGAAAAARVLSLIGQGEVEVEAATAVVDEMMCVGCSQCIETCPYTAIEYFEDRGVAHVIEALCKGCGTCAATCPSKAMMLRHFTDRQLISEMLGAMSAMVEFERELVPA